MKRFPWLRRRLPLLLLVAVAGCSPEPDPVNRAERDFFAVAASRLDPQGSFYFIANFGNLRRSFGEWLRRSQIAIAEAESSDECRERLQLAASGGELALRLLGADFLAGVGASSVRLSSPAENGEALFRNRLFFISREGRKGPIWESGGSPSPRLAWLDSLPADTWLAAALAVDPVRFFSALERNREAAGNLDRFCKLFTGTSARDLLAGFSGEWQLVVSGNPDAPDGTLAGVRAVLVIPDRENRLFNRLKALGKADGNGERIVFPGAVGTADGVAPVLLRRPDLLVFCSSPAAEPVGAFVADSRAVAGEGAPPVPPWRVSLGGQPRFRRFAEGLPAESDIVLFCQEPPGEKTSRLRIAGVNMPIGGGRDAMVLSVAQLFDDGWLVTSHSSTDLNEDIFFESVIFPALAVARIVTDRNAGRRSSDPRDIPSAAEAGNRDESPSSSAPAPADPPAELEACSEAIRRTGEALRAAAGDATPDIPPQFRRFIPPAAMNKDEVPSEFPLLLDRPERHRDGFHVFYHSGGTEWIPLERPASFRRMIGALQTRHRYDEAVFIELIRQAAEFDRSAEPENSSPETRK